MEPASDIAEPAEFVAYLGKPRNGVKLPAQLAACMAHHFVTGMKLVSTDEIEVDEPDEMEEVATEAWSGKFGEDLPKAFATRVRKFAGETSTSAGKKESLASPLGVGEIGEEERRSAAKKEALGLGYLTPFEKEKAMSDMAAQGLSSERITSLSLSLVVGKVSKLSESVDMKYGEDPALSETAKQARKAGKKLLSGLIKEANYANTAAFFTDIMRGYAALGMVEESSLVASWWAETSGCFKDNDALFKYLDAYFEKYAGRGLPVTIDTVLVTRLRQAGGEGVVALKEDIGKLKKRIDDLEKGNSSLKQSVEQLKTKVGKQKPTAEEQEERKKNVVCHNCGEKGHYQSECPHEKK